jgi:hypothetical protein
VIQDDINAALQTAAGDAVYPVLASDTQQGAFLVYQIVNADDLYSLSGRASPVNARVQVDAWVPAALGYRAAQALLRSARAALESATAFRVAGATQNPDFFDEDARAHRASMDFSIWYEDA